MENHSGTQIYHGRRSTAILGACDRELSVCRYPGGKDIVRSVKFQVVVPNTLILGTHLFGTNFY